MFDDPKNPLAQMQADGVKIFTFKAGKIARNLGNFRLVNSVMLGAISSYLPFDSNILKNSILDRLRKSKPKLVDINAQAFNRGRESVAEA